MYNQSQRIKCTKCTTAKATSISIKREKIQVNRRSGRRGVSLWCRAGTTSRDERKQGTVTGVGWSSPLPGTEKLWLSTEDKGYCIFASFSKVNYDVKLLTCATTGIVAATSYVKYMVMYLRVGMQWKCLYLSWRVMASLLISEAVATNDSRSCLIKSMMWLFESW